MASLRNRIEQGLRRGASGQLVGGTAPTPVGQLASQMGVAAPITPNSGALVGANPDQQKMIGTPPQKRAALRQSLDLANTIGEEQAQTRAPGEAPQALRDKVARSQEIFSDTRSKVQKLVGNAAANLQQAQPTLARPATMAPAAQAPATPGSTPAPQPTQADVDQAFSTAASLAAAGTDPADPAFQDAVNQLFNLTGLSQQEIMDRINQSAAVDPGSVGKAADAQIGSNILASQLYSELGTTGAELAVLLGIPEDQIANYTVDQLAAALGSVSQQTQGTAITAGSGLVGAAERGAAREQLQDLSRSGVMSLEDDLGELSGALERADSIQFGGRDWTVEELLGDGNISRLLTEYLLNPTSKSSQQFAADPQTKPLLDFAKNYRTSLTAAAKQMGKAVSESQRRVDENAALSKIDDVELPPEMMTLIYGEGWNKRGAEVQKPKGVILSLTALPEDQRKEAVTQFSEAFRKYPEARQQLANITPEVMKSLFANNGVAWKSYSTSLDYANKLSQLDTPEELAALLGGTLAELENEVSVARNLVRTGQSTDRSLLDLIDANGDVRMDSIDDIKKRIQLRTPVLTLEQVLSPTTMRLGRVTVTTSPIREQRLPPTISSIKPKMPPAVQADMDALAGLNIRDEQQLRSAAPFSVPEDLLQRIMLRGGSYGTAAREALNALHAAQRKDKEEFERKQAQNQANLDAANKRIEENNKTFSSGIGAPQIS